MGIVRGTKLALVGAVGAVLAWWFRLGAELRQYEHVREALELPLIEALVAEHGVVLDWSVGVFVGVVVADLFGHLRRRDGNRSVEPSSTLGVGKGAAAAVAGSLALTFDDRIFAELSRIAPEVAAFVLTVPGGKAGVCFALGIWVGAVVADLIRL
jgi:hypothetical protein